VSERDLPAACAAIDEDLSAWLDGELDASGAAIVRDHVEGCARCAARVAALRAVDAELQALVAAEPSEAERQRLARLRARLAEEQRRLQPLPGRAVAPDEAAASGAAGKGAAADARAAAPPRRRRWLPAAGAAIAAALLAALLLPGLFERARTPSPGADLAARESAPAAPPTAALPPPPAAPPAREPVAKLLPPEGTGGRLGASAFDEEARSPGSAAGAAAAALDPAAAPAPEPEAAEPDDVDLAIALAGLGDVDPADLAVVERLDALARMTSLGAGAGESSR